MIRSRLEYLFNCYILQNCSEEEEEELMKLLSDSENEAGVKKLLDKVFENAEFESAMTDENAASILRNIFNEEKAKVVPIEKNKPGINFWRRVAAAVVVLFICGTVYWLLTGKNRENSVTSIAHSSAKSAKILPGGKKAILTLSDGSQVILDSVENGNIVSQGNIKVIKQGGQLFYTSSKGVKQEKVLFNTISTPRGGEYQVVLSDGSKVWLNAESELKFPLAFTEGERTVYLRGEAFFEVAKDATKPFRVHVSSTTVEALGTAFNINTHLIPGRVKTILTEGKIRVVDGAQKQVITEGYATISGGGTIDAELADLEEALAWKDGYFYFTGKNLREILEDVARWYNVGVKIEKPVNSEKYKGGIKRTESIEAVCKMLNALTDSQISIENRTLILK